MNTCRTCLFYKFIMKQSDLRESRIINKFSDNKSILWDSTSYFDAYHIGESRWPRLAFLACVHLVWKSGDSYQK